MLQFDICFMFCFCLFSFVIVPVASTLTVAVQNTGCCHCGLSGMKQMTLFDRIEGMWTQSKQMCSCARIDCTLLNLPKCVFYLEYMIVAMLSIFMMSIMVVGFVITLRFLCKISCVNSTCEYFTIAWCLYFEWLWYYYCLIIMLKMVCW